jgi:large subunit ribosomal protein L5
MAEQEKKPAAKPAKAGAPAEAKKKDKKKGASGDSYYQVEAADAVRANRPARLKKRYDQEIAPALMKKLGLKNVMEVPRLTRVVVNACAKESVSNPKILESVMGELAVITGQKPILTRSKKSIAQFKLREGLAIGAMVTLRKKLMYEFVDRLVNLTLPRVRDFSGVPTTSFDGRGNYTLGLREQIIFPEIDYDKVDANRGMNITFVTTAKDNESARALLTELGMPFKK